MTFQHWNKSAALPASCTRVAGLRFEPMQSTPKHQLRERCAINAIERWLCTNFHWVVIKLQVPNDVTRCCVRLTCNSPMAGCD
jgi:hypothetical protein